MAIYLPYRDFRRSAKCLSDAHLDEQRKTVRKLIQDIVVLHRDDEQWSGHVTQLLFVCEATLCERVRRGRDERGVVPWMLDHGDPEPGWLGLEEFHAQERMKLLHLDPQHYGKMGWRS